MSWGVAGGPSLWSWSSLRREADLPWEWLGDNPLCPNSVEFRNLHRSKPPRAPMSLTQSGIESKKLYIIELCFTNNMYDVDCMISLNSISLRFLFMLFSLCVVLCNDHLRLVWAKLNPDEDTPPLDRSWSWA